MKFSMFAAAALLTCPVVAHAQDISGAFTLGYSNTSVSNGGGDFSTPTLDARVQADFGNVSLGGRLDVLKPEDSGATGSLIGIDGAYRFANNMRLGGYVERAQVSGDGDTLSGTSYGLTTGFESNGVDFSAFFGKTDSDVLPSDASVKTLGFGATYQASPALRLASSFARTELSDGVDSVALSSVGVAGTYQITDEFAAFGGIVHNSVDTVDLGLTTLGLGASYDLTKVASFPIVVSLELARTNLNVGGTNGNLDSIRLGLTIPFGKASTKTPLNSVADSIFAPTHSVVSSLVNTTF